MQDFDHLLIVLTEIRPLINANWIFLISNNNARLRGASKASALAIPRGDAIWTVQQLLGYFSKGRYFLVFSSSAAITGTFLPDLCMSGWYTETCLILVHDFQRAVFVWPDWETGWQICWEPVLKGKQSRKAGHSSRIPLEGTGSGCSCVPKDELMGKKPAWMNSGFWLEVRTNDESSSPLKKRPGHPGGSQGCHKLEQREKQKGQKPLITLMILWLHWIYKTILLVHKKVNRMLAVLRVRTMESMLRTSEFPLHCRSWTEWHIWSFVYQIQKLPLEHGCWYQSLCANSSYQVFYRGWQAEGSTWE